MKKCIILGNGKAPSKSALSYLIKCGYSTIFCADGGADSSKKLGITPDFIIGDLDSVLPSTLDFYSGKSAILKIKRQNDTDIEKCIKYAVSKNFTDIFLTGVIGNRLDHSLCNLGIVLKFYSKAKLKILSEESVLVPYTGTVELPVMPKEIFSLYGFNDKTKITSKGLYYPLKQTALPFGKKESTSNVTTGEKVSLIIKGGIIFVIRQFKVIRNNGLINTL